MTTKGKTEFYCAAYRWFKLSPSDAKPTASLTSSWNAVNRLQAADRGLWMAGTRPLKPWAPVSWGVCWPSGRCFWKGTYQRVASAGFRAAPLSQSPSAPACAALGSEPQRACVCGARLSARVVDRGARGSQRACVAVARAVGCLLS